MINLTTLEFVFTIISVLVSGVIIGIAIFTIVDAIRGFKERK